MPRANKNRKYISPDNELIMVMAKGGPGIDKQMVLGDNVNLTDKMILAPMGPDEKLFQVQAQGQRSYRTAAQHAASVIALHHSPNDVSQQQPALFPDGKRRPAMPDNPFSEDKLFADNFIFIGETSDCGRILDFCKCFGLTKEGNPLATQRISSRGIRKLKTDRGKFHRWKIAAADVPIKVIKFIIFVYNYAQAWDDDLVAMAKWATDKCKQHMDSFRMTYADLVAAVTMVQKKEVRIIELDLTIDLPGTFHAQEFTDTVKRAGHKVIDSTACGLQCIKFTIGDDGVIYKVYNKVLETMQQGAARMSNWEDKFSYLLHPSTDGLQNKVCDPTYNLNGITRLEITYPFTTRASDGRLTATPWTSKKMIAHFSKAHELLAGRLVRCSIHNHILGMEPFLKRSVVIYYPYTFDFKVHKKLWAKDGVTSNNPRVSCRPMPL
jgi:hypothetical protein